MRAEDEDEDDDDVVIHDEEEDDDDDDDDDEDDEDDEEDGDEMDQDDEDEGDNKEVRLSATCSRSPPPLADFTCYLPIQRIDPTAILPPGARRSARSNRVDYSSAEALKRAGLQPGQPGGDEDAEMKS